MKKKREKTQKNLELEQNQVEITLAMFLEFYNNNIPKGFPRASVQSLKTFQDAHATLFKKNGMWSVDKHRKRLIDWASSHSELS